MEEYEKIWHKKISACGFDWNICTAGKRVCGCRETEYQSDHPAGK